MRRVSWLIAIGSVLAGGCVVEGPDDDDGEATLLAPGPGWGADRGSGEDPGDDGTPNDDEGSDPDPDPQEPAACPWPDGTPGVAIDQTIPENLSWQGYLPGNPEPSTLTARDLYDCTGEKGINAVLFSTSKFFCSACYQEMSELESWMNEWEPRGIKVVVPLVNDSNDGPPTLDGALTWKTQFSLERVSVLVDPSYSLVPAHLTQIGTPMQTIVDPRTMRVVARIDGLPSNFLILENLAANNGG